MSKTKPCGRATGLGACDIPRMKGKQRCLWHWLIAQSPDVQRQYAEARRRDAPPPLRSRVKPEEWPAGRRWCAGCQWMVPLFYTSQSRCKSCASVASHAARVQSTYGLPPEDYDELLRYQEGRCYICRRLPLSKRLAVDHDHKTGVVRGLLCASNENGCNRAVVGNLEAAGDGGLSAAKRALEYLKDPPYARLQRLGRISTTSLS